MSEKIPTPEGTIPHRSTTMSSNSDDAAIPADSGDVGALLVERLRAWKHAVGYLEAYVSQTESLHRGLHKEYQKVLKTIDEPLKEAHHFEQTVGGTASFFESLRANTVGLSTSHTETATALKGTVLPILERLHKAIKDRSKHVQSECERAAKAVSKSRSSTQQHIELLGQHSGAFDSVGGVSATHTGGLHLHTSNKQKPENDPYLLRRGVLQRLTKQVAEENTQRNELIGVQTHFGQFEAQIVQQIQQALAALDASLAAQSERERALYADVLAKAQALPLEFEWINFQHRYAAVLIDASAPPRTVESIRFPNEAHAATKPLFEGGLSRKGKIMRSYNAGYYVVTPAKYLHEFKDQDSLHKNPEPELSLFLPDCTIGALSKDGKFVISGKDSGSMLATKHEYAFKAGNYSEGQRWHEAISGCAGLKTNESPVMSPMSPTATAGPVEGAGPPAYSRHNSHESGVTMVTGTTAPPPVAGAAEKAA
ncbi:hypothetical protein EDC01DRAFT_675802 [Geopyxis carbonaria]|nr:hypothetical protein EDC01DRAFT_675802 [Geopyxis carbonaria]